jgi:hypothetical protein
MADASIVTPARDGQAFTIRPQHRDVRTGVTANESRRNGLAAMQPDFDILVAFDDVVRRDDHPIG